ncbi:MAG: hypothetical protein K2X86_14365 [Cytophagaceae bacterium]|nr:hypothetical protein [Cytophagaceae bacterium]
MKNQYLTLLCIVILALIVINCSGTKISSATSSQDDRSGIYKTAADFTSSKLSLEVDCKSEKHKIKTHDFSGKPYIDIIHEGKEYRYQKSEIYGYRDCDGNDYRFVDKTEYKILESKSITLYELTVLKPNPYGKGTASVKENYFSVSPDSELKTLTIFSLKDAFPNNHTFHDQLDDTFKYDQDLMEYDSFHKAYKINHLLKTTLEK